MAVGWGIEVTGARQLQKALRVLSEPDAPFLRKALERAGGIVRLAAASRTKGGIAQAVDFVGVKGSPSGLRAVIKIKHPGALPMEFGRIYYYDGYSGRNAKSGRRGRHVPGQKAVPFLGIIKGDAAIAATKDEVRELLLEAFEREWERIGAES